MSINEVSTRFRPALLGLLLDGDKSVQEVDVARVQEVHQKLLLKTLEEQIDANLDGWLSELTSHASLEVDTYWAWYGPEDIAAFKPSTLSLRALDPEARRGVLRAALMFEAERVVAGVALPFTEADNARIAEKSAPTPLTPAERQEPQHTPPALFAALRDAGIKGRVVAEIIGINETTMSQVAAGRRRWTGFDMASLNGLLAQVSQHEAALVRAREAVLAEQKALAFGPAPPRKRGK